MIVTNENCKAIALWQIQLSGMSDFFGALTRTTAGVMEFTFRFRYYNDDRLGADSQDEKHWYKCDMTSLTQAKALKECREITADLASFVNATVCEIEVGPDGMEGAMAKMKQLPQFHFEETASRDAPHVMCWRKITPADVAALEAAT